MNEQTEEMTFKASVIDGTMLSIADYVEARKIDDVRILYFLIHEAYSILCISVQTSDEQALWQHLDRIIAQNKN